MARSCPVRFRADSCELPFPMRPGAAEMRSAGIRYNQGLGEIRLRMAAKGKGKASKETARRRRLRFYRTRGRELWRIAKALVSTKHPFLVHIIPMRRCNLACTYCNEFDDNSKPVAVEEIKNRLDLLADMGTSIITISGGEPLMHPDLDEIIRHIRRRGMIAGLITNGFFLNKERIERLNDAGLEHLQISIDNVTPDEVSKKSLKSLDGRLEMLSEWATFQVNINSVLGSGVKNSEDALTIAHRALELGFTSTVGIRKFSKRLWRWGSGRSRASMSFSITWRRAASTTGNAAQVRVTCISARTGWCTGARSSGATRGFRWRATPRRCVTGNT